MTLAAAPPDRVSSPDVVAGLLARSVLLVTGKGGVGKSTVAVALARLAASRGKRVLLVELESVSHAGPLFKRPVGAQPVDVAPRLTAVCLQTADSLRHFALQQLKVPALVNLALRNRSVEHFFQAMPAIKPILFLYHLWCLESIHGPHGDARWDLIVCDLPTTGFAIGMYEIPRTLSTVFRLGPIAGYADGMQKLLGDPRRTGLVLVALPEEMPLVETIELHAAMQRRFGVEAAAVVVNGMFPELVAPADLAELRAALDRPGTPDAATTAPANSDAALAAWRWAAEVVASRRQRATEALPRLRAVVGDRVLALPFLFRRDLPLDAIDGLAARLGGQDGEPR